MLNVNVVYRLQIVDKDSQDLRKSSRSGQKVIKQCQSAFHSCSWSRFTRSWTVRRQKCPVFGSSSAHHYMSACSDIILRQLVHGTPQMISSWPLTKAAQVSTPGQFKWDLRWTVCQWGRFISVYISISLTISSNHSSNLHRSSTTDNLRK
jgi:hypothetical protein